MKSNPLIQEPAIKNIVSAFDTEGTVSGIIAHDNGHINDSFIIETEGDHRPDYLLQRKNSLVFPDIPSMMDNIEKITGHLQNSIRQDGGDPQRQSLTLVKTRKGQAYYRDDSGEYWAMCILIRDHILIEKASSPAWAYAGGKGIGRFQKLLADYSQPLAETLPGFHDIAHRFRQWDEVLEEDPRGRKPVLEEEIAWIEDRRTSMMQFMQKIADLPLRVTHNDPKISNILFETGQQPLCMIDLDTVMAGTVLYDFGDAIRSFTNTASEDERDRGRIRMDIALFNSFTRGFLSETGSFLTPEEIDNLAFSALYITFEQVLRFLMDYINGDVYYRIGFPDHNLIRASAQYRLLQSMESQFGEMEKIISNTAKEMSGENTNDRP